MDWGMEWENLKKSNFLKKGKYSYFMKIECARELLPNFSICFFLQRAKRSITNKFKYVGIGDGIVAVLGLGQALLINNKPKLWLQIC